MFADYNTSVVEQLGKVCLNERFMPYSTLSCFMTQNTTCKTHLLSVLKIEMDILNYEYNCKLVALHLALAFT